VIAFQVPNDANRTQVVSPAQMQNFLHHFRCLVGHLIWDGLLLDKAVITLCLIRFSPLTGGYDFAA
jgi:hypothetical protein